MPSHLTLPPDCTLAQSANLHAILLEGFANLAGDTLTIDASGVREADISLVQLLVASEKTALAGGGRVLLDASPVVRGLLSGVGLAGWPGAAGF